ncbi:uncharacterized protein PB18E9.04c isoform X2 [Sphaeramia orbicularis]|nr:uncharacterized protein PB18E9.04c-like isoform X2 [Sphaeramia orbicularis]
MALSQIQCLDDNHVNPRTTESKPEFFYCEDQRLALETLLRDGREAFVKYLEARGLRGFLSDPELESLVGSVEPYDPGLELIPESGEEEDEPPLSLHYWPELSDVSIPQLDLGWPDSDGYRGVSRATVYTQPPLDGQAHIKEIIRKMIAQAQRVIAVVMDIFTDVDIFRDLLDVAFKKKVSVYILLERTTLPHFLSMCHRANMHAGHLKNLRVRCSIGAEFHTRACTKVKGRIGHRFMFVDGDKAVSGSYSFTWMSSRLDRNLITVLTGQVVDTFDLLFRFLYMNSTSVNLRQIAKEPQPEPDPPPQQTTFAPPSADVARKLYNPKYALVAACNPSLSPNSSGNNSPKDSQNAVNSKTQEDEATSKKKRRRDKEVRQEPPLHPGLTNLGKAHLIEYLPTWPEPDPPSDVIGFINVRDTSKPIQVHLQRSEMFETSQAIRFGSPPSMPKETLPEVANPRKIGANDEENPKQDKTKAEEAAVVQTNSTPLTLKASGFKSQEAPEQKSQIIVKTLNTECNLQSNTPTKNQSAGHNSTSNINKSTSQQSSSTATPSQITPTIPTNSLKTEPLPKSDAQTQAQTRTSLNTHHALDHSVHSSELKSTQTQISQTLSATDLNANTEQFAQSKKLLQHTYSSKQDVHTKTQNSVNTQTPNIHNHISPSSAFTSLHCNPVTPVTLSDNNQVCATTVHSSMTSSARAPVLPLTSITTTPSFPTVSSSSTTHPLSSSTFTTAPPVPKRRTVQLVINDTTNGQNPPDINAVRRPESLTSTQLVASHNEPLVATVVHTLPKKEPETVPKLQNKTDAQKGTENTGKDCSPLRTSQEIKSEEAAGQRNDRVDTKRAPGSKLQVQSNVLITNAPKENCTNIQDTPLTSTECNITKKIEDCVDPLAKVRPLRDKEAGKVLSEDSKNLAHSKTYPSRVNGPQRVSHNELNAKDTTVLGAEDSVNATKDSPVSATFRAHIDRADDSTSTADSQNQHPGVATAYHINSLPDAAKHNTNNTFQDSLQSPKGRGIPHSPIHLGLSESYTPYLRSPTPEKESRLLFALTRTPTPDGLSPHSPNSDSRSRTPDFRTPTPDGYFSTFSTTSEEYFECSDSPVHDVFFDPVASFGNETEDDLNTNTSYAPTITTASSSPTFVNTTTSPGVLSSSGKNTSRSGTLSQYYGVSSVSSPEKKLKMMEEEKTINDEKWKEQDGKKSLTERSNQTQRDSQRTERRGSKENKSAEHLRQNKASTEAQLTADKAKETQASKRKKALNQQEAGDDVVTPGESSNEAMQMSVGEVKAKNMFEGGRPDKASSGGEKTLDRAGLRASGVEKTLQTTRESEGQKYSVQPTPVI